MEGVNDALFPAMAALIEYLPESAIPPLAEAITGVTPGAWAALHATATRVLAAPHYREQVGAFVTTWQTQAPSVPPACVAVALQAAASAVGRQRRAQTVEVVWTGPTSTQPLRRTAQVLLTPHCPHHQYRFLVRPLHTSIRYCGAHTTARLSLAYGGQSQSSCCVCLRYLLLNHILTSRCRTEAPGRLHSRSLNRQDPWPSGWLSAQSGQSSTGRREP